MKPELAVGGVGIFVSSSFGAVAYHSTGDILGAIVAATALAAGFVLFAYFIRTYSSIGDIWEQNTVSTVTLLVLYTILFAAVTIEITDPLTVMGTMTGVGIVGYMSGVLHLASSHPAISRSD